MIKPTTKEINDFISVAEAGNFSKAADRLDVKQSGLSKSIRRLEEELGIQLFMRGPRTLKLTDAGQIYYDEVKKIEQDWYQANQRVKSLSSEINGKFTIALHSMIAKYVLPNLYKNILKWPGLELSSELRTSREAVEMVRDMQADLAVAVDPLPYPDLVVRPLWKEFGGLYSKSGEMQQTILFNEAMIGHKEMVSSFSYLQVIPINDYQVLYSIVKRNPNMMALLPNPIAENEGRLKLIKKMSKPKNVCLVYRQDRLKTKGFRYLLDCLKF